jgi:hypothetical protein
VAADECFEGVERLLREGREAADELGPEGARFAVGVGEGLGDEPAAEVALEEPQFLLASRDKASVALTVKRPRFGGSVTCTTPHFRGRSARPR